MSLLLDTHTFIWLVGESERLSATTVGALTDRDNELFVSAASMWEIAIKAATGKIRAEPRDLLADMNGNGIRMLSVTMTHAIGVRDLPRHHGDPFDRMLVAQALAENLTIVTANRIFRLYPAPILAA